MSAKAVSLLSPQQIDALLVAQCTDIFSVLGMHPHPEHSGLVVRALLPGATAVDVIDSADNKRVAALAMVDEDGLFEGPPGRRRKPFAYRLRIHYPDAVIEQEDPYRFGSLLSDDDLYLFCEGTQEQVYRWMGAHPRGC